MASTAIAPRTRLATKGVTTIYDSYPLSLRTFLAEEGLPPFARSKAHSMEGPAQKLMAVDDDEYLHNFYDSSSSVDTIDLGNEGITEPTAPVSSSFGKYHNEVFETKERSKVLSALRHRGKAGNKASKMKKRVPVAPSTFTADDVLRAGTLIKQGSWRRNWKTRFFILRSDCPSLCYFTSEDKLELLGDIPITEDTIILDRSGGGHAPFRFQIRTDAQTLLLEAESRDNQSRWIEACQELADAIRASKFSVNMPVSNFSFDGPQSSHVSGSTTTTFRTTEKENSSGLEESVSSSQNWHDTETSGVDEVEGSLKVTTTSHRYSASGSVSSATQDNGLRPSRRLYDLSISVVMGRRCKLVEHAAFVDKEKDRAGCFVTISGYLRKSNTLVELGVTDSIKLTTLLAVCGANSSGLGKQAPVPFSVVLTSELECFDHLRLELCKTQLMQSPGNNQGTIGVGRCLLDGQLLGSTPCAVTMADRSSPTQDMLVTNHPLLDYKTTGDPSGPLSIKSGLSVSLANDSEMVQLVVQVFRSVSPQNVLPTTGVDMANSKYLIPTTLAPGRETTGKFATETRMDFSNLTRGSDVHTFMENDPFVSSLSSGTLSEALNGNLRHVVVDEILRVPRSTFALPIAYLDFLEEQALERSRFLQKQLHAMEDFPRETERLITEVDFLRKKQEEYLKQRQFLIRQEKRLLTEQSDGKFFMAAERAGTVFAASDSPGALNASTAISGAAGANDADAVAPFKRSTYKNLNLWQFLPTNMQDQFLCTCKPPRSDTALSRLSSRPFVWHTMTMGCPAAHTKGFANGGYPATGPIETVSLIGLGDDDPVVAKNQEGESSSPTSPVISSKLGTLHHTSSCADDSLAAFKLRLELQDRLSVIGSQILSAAAACILASLDLAVNGSAFHQAQLDRAATFGFFMHFESLLSTQGKEYGMLEDFAAGARWLRTVSIQFRRHLSTGSFFSLKKYTPPNFHDNHCLLLTIGINEDHKAVLPPSLGSGDGVVPIRCVLFTQGVNEKQSLVHAYKSSAVKLQERVNRDNLAELKRIYALYCRLWTEETDKRVRQNSRLRAYSAIALDDVEEAAKALDRHDLQALDDLLAQIEHHICSSSSQYKKNVALLMDSSDFCRALGAARVTCCKSGKDRTAMSVTLEQTRVLCAELQASQGATICANMRLYGVRRRNVFMNTRADKFAFNEMQRKMLPECYKPPAGTYKSGKT
ncbi:uncharacterized protein CCR75_006992 [Bremia lactucae]|uniref:PH domain-containing protein n=1 Tax=Bremia lactucae TaxID=4779 RepID=A0A976IIA0_BRELC|nr:hypothetical protein CCR75_006992 [Bremia lactucae]